MNDDSGSFMIQPRLEGDDHVNFELEGYLPFTLGDLNPRGMYIHAFDPESIRYVLTRLDTITDFTTYLNKRAEYLRSGLLSLSHGEEELLGRYLTIGMFSGEYNFDVKRPKKFKNAPTSTLQGEWRAYLFSRGVLRERDG